MKKNKGFSILMTIIVIVIMSALGLIGLSILTTETQMTVDTMTSAQAFFIAEGGLQYYFEQLQNQSSSWATPPAKPANKALGNGTFTITTANEQQDQIDVTSTANVTGMDGGTTVRITTARFTRGGGLVACSYVIYTSGNYTPGAVIVGDILEGATIFPTVDFTYYYNLAPVAQRVSGNKTFYAGTYSGIWYVNGSVTIRSDVTINGTIIATGAISCSNRNNVTINPSSPYPALVANDSIGFGNINNLSITRMTYSGVDGSGGTSITNSIGTVFGKIMARGNVNASGTTNLHITYDLSLKGITWPGFSGGGSGGGMSNWKEV